MAADKNGRSSSVVAYGDKDIGRISGFVNLSTIPGTKGGKIGYAPQGMRIAHLSSARDYDQVFLSPHLDDAALSCGGWIAMAVRAGQRVLVATICSQVPVEQCDTPRASGPWYVPDRRREDEEAMDRLGADFVWMEELDAPFRCGAAYGDSPFVSPCSDDPLPASVADQVQALGELMPQATLHAPLGVGSHVDHLVAFDAARRATTWQKVWFYEDFPYVLASPHALADRLSAASIDLVPVDVDIRQTLEIKKRSVSCYRSQLDMLFGTEARMRAAIDQCALSRGAVHPIERQWTSMDLIDRQENSP